MKYLQLIIDNKDTIYQAIQVIAGAVGIVYLTIKATLAKINSTESKKAETYLAAGHSPNKVTDYVKLGIDAVEKIDELRKKK